MSFWINMEVYAWDEVLFIVVLFKLITMAYLFSTGYSKYWLAVIPFGHMYVKHELAGVNIVLLICQAIVSVLSLLSYDIACSIVMLVLVVITNIQFSKVYVDDYSPYVYSLVPFAKYIIMCREVYLYARNAAR